MGLRTAFNGCRSISILVKSLALEATSDAY